MFFKYLICWLSRFKLQISCMGWQQWQHSAQMSFPPPMLKLGSELSIGYVLGIKKPLQCIFLPAWTDKLILHKYHFYSMFCHLDRFNTVQNIIIPYYSVIHGVLSPHWPSKVANWSLKCPPCLFGERSHAHDLV